MKKKNDPPQELRKGHNERKSLGGACRLKPCIRTRALSFFGIQEDAAGKGQPEQNAATVQLIGTHGGADQGMTGQPQNRHGAVLLRPPRPAA